MRPYILSETNWKEIREIQFDLAVLPWGATEAHNFHLPYGTDVFEADAIAAAAAKLAWESGCRIIVLPTVPFGVNTGQHDILLDINLNPTTQLLILSDIIAGLDRQGIRKLLVLNSHGGNDFKPLLRELGLKFPSVYLTCCNWFQALNKSEFFEKDGDHADEMETSLMLFLNEQLVAPLSEAGAGTERKHVMGAFLEGWAWSERKWSMVTADTGIGDPRLATKQKGEKYFNALTTKLGEFMKELSQLDVENMYK